jgi:hypothetical protein
VPLPHCHFRICHCHSPPPHTLTTDAMIRATLLRHAGTSKLAMGLKCLFECQNTPLFLFFFSLFFLAGFKFNEISA